jgi:hypothetical protein
LARAPSCSRYFCSLAGVEVFEGGNAGKRLIVDMFMDTIPRIHAEIDELSERRVALWNSLSFGRDPEVVEQIKALDARLDALWAQHRAERARIRFGERDDIVRRARAEERLERAA